MLTKHRSIKVMCQCEFYCEQSRVRVIIGRGDISRQRRGTDAAVAYRTDRQRLHLLAVNS